MRKRIFKLFKSLIVVLAIFSCAGTSFSAVNSSKIQNGRGSNLQKGHDNYWRISGEESSQILTPQTYRTVHFVKGVFIAPDNFAVCLKCQNFFSGNEKQGQAQFQKLLLFPFHVFW